MEASAVGSLAPPCAPVHVPTTCPTMCSHHHTPRDVLHHVIPSHVPIPCSITCSHHVLPSHSHPVFHYMPPHVLHHIHHHVHHYLLPPHVPMVMRCLTIGLKQRGQNQKPRWHLPPFKHCLGCSVAGEERMTHTQAFPKRERGDL